MVIMMIKMMITMMITIMMISLRGIYSYIPETNHVSTVRNVEAHSVVTTYGKSNVIFHDKLLYLDYFPDCHHSDYLHESSAALLSDCRTLIPPTRLREFVTSIQAC